MIYYDDGDFDGGDDDYGRWFWYCWTDDYRWFRMMITMTDYDDEDNNGDNEYDGDYG